VDANKEISVLIAEDDEGHAALIVRNLKRAGISNDIIRFRDGQEILDFLFRNGNAVHRKNNHAYLLLLDIRMPKVDGVEVLTKIKADEVLCKMPVIMLTTTDDPKEIVRCHEIGCNNYITKPIDYDQFIDCINKLGLFIKIVKVPQIDGE